MTDTSHPTAGTIAGAARSEREEELIVNEPTPTGKLVDKVKSKGEQLTDQAADKAKGFVDQGIEKSSAAIASVSRLISDSADGLEEKIGAEYAGYARKAATTLDDVATRLKAKDADELVSDTRDFVKRNPGLAVAGAAVAGFFLSRLLKSSNERA